MPRVIIADDERPLREALARFLRSLKMEVEAVGSGEEALARLDGCDLVVSDVRMPGIDGMTLLAEVRKRRPGVPVVLITGHGTIGLAVDAMRAGAANFITKPFDLDDLEAAVRTALAGVGAASGITPPRAQVSPPPAPTAAHGHGHAAPSPAKIQTEIIGESTPVRHLRDLVRRIAASEATVLVTGDSGSGKEVVARVIHAQGRRANKPFVAVNCGAIPEALLESELFGHMKGAFTGATQTRVGRFGAADGGILLLDEIGELPLLLQVKLLRVLQERVYTPVGSSEAHPADVRVIAATNRDLEAMISAGTFREDLYYRLNVLSVAVPPLRDRGDDILLLARTFLERTAIAEGRGTMRYDDDVARCLLRYSWPGNVRELEHAMTRATVLAQDTTLSLVDLPVKVRAAFALPAPATRPAEDLEVTSPGLPRLLAPAIPSAGLDLNETLENVERRLIVDALERTAGNRKRAAALLGIRRTTLVEKLKRLGLVPQDHE